jgi:predicted nucleic acid-binding protein
MKYWDASAIVPLLVAEEGSSLVRDWLRDDPVVVTWALTVVEICSAIERRVRQGLISTSDRPQLLDVVRQLADGWDEVHDLLAVRAHATTLLARHSLRAADALQLSAACLVSEGDPSSLTFVCLDRNLTDAASREGFVIQSWG